MESDGNQLRVLKPKKEKRFPHAGKKPSSPGKNIQIRKINILNKILMQVFKDKYKLYEKMEKKLI